MRPRYRELPRSHSAKGTIVVTRAVRRNAYPRYLVVCVLCILLALSLSLKRARAEVLWPGDLFYSGLFLGSVQAWFRVPIPELSENDARIFLTLSANCFNSGIPMTGENERPVGVPEFIEGDIGVWQQQLTAIISSKMELKDPGPPNLLWQIGLRAGQAGIYEQWGRNERVLQLLWSETAQLLQRADFKEIIPVRTNEIREIGALMRTQAPREAAVTFQTRAVPIINTLASPCV